MALAYNPHPMQVAAHRAILVDGYKRATLFWGRQVGKTMWSVYQSWIAACMSQGQYFIVFRTYSQASQVVWKQYIHTIPKEIIHHIDNDDLRITFNYMKGNIILPGIGEIAVDHDENKPRSTLRLLGSDQAESHRGNKANGMIFDEYADQNPTNWEEVYKYFFTTTKGWAVFMGTPKGYNHWYDMLEDARKHPERWYYSKATWRDNPAIDPQFVADEREEADRKGKLNAFLQEMELEFRAVQGSVYPMFKRAIHVKKIEDMPVEGTVYATIDFGWAQDHPTAINLVKIDIEDRWWVYDEVHVVETDLKDALKTLRLKLGEERLVALVADSARPDLIAICQAEGFPVVPVNKGGRSVSSGIALLGARMKPRLQLEGLPKPQIFFVNVPQTILEFEQYKYAEPKKDRPPTEEPVKKYDNHPDGLRYLALYLKLNSGGQDRKDFVKMEDFGEFGTMPL